jgi:hypothetical protein
MTSTVTTTTIVAVSSGATDLFELIAVLAFLAVIVCREATLAGDRGRVARVFNLGLVPLAFGFVMIAITNLHAILT